MSGVIDREFTPDPDADVKVVSVNVDGLVILLLEFTIGPHPRAPELPIPARGRMGAGDPGFDSTCLRELQPVLSPNFLGFVSIDAIDVERRGVGMCESRC